MTNSSFNCILSFSHSLIVMAGLLNGTPGCRLRDLEAQSALGKSIMYWERHILLEGNGSQ